MRKLVYRLTISIMAIVCMESCSNLGNELPYSEIPKGVLIDRIPVNMDIMFTSVRGVLQQPEFYDRRGRLLENFLDDPTCNSLIYDSEDGQLVPMKQIFLMDSATGEVVQATNLDLILSVFKRSMKQLWSLWPSVRIRITTGKSMTRISRISV